MYIFWIPFGLINVGATFKRAMDFSFKEYIDKFMVFYQDDLIAYSRKAKDHMRHLEKIFEKALEYVVSLNPKKCTFGVKKGKLLGYIVSKDRVKIDPKRVVAIDNIPKTKNVKGIQYFFCQVIFLRRFVTNFPEISRPISKMLKKGAMISWEGEPLVAFQEIKDAIKNAPVLRTPYYAKPMHIFSFSSFHTIATVLLQRNEEGYEKPIAFFGKSL